MAEVEDFELNGLNSADAGLVSIINGFQMTWLLTWAKIWNKSNLFKLEGNSNWLDGNLIWLNRGLVWFK